MEIKSYLILSAVLLMTACAGGAASESAPRKVKCESAQAMSDNVERVTFHGRVTPAKDVNIGFRVAGIIDEICATDGAFVRKGEVIARLDKRDYALQLAATEAEATAIRAEAERVIALYAEQSVPANDYDKATNAIRAITAKEEAHRSALSDTDLRAPFDGYIQRHNFDRGEAVAAGTPVMALISSAAPEITIDIPASYYLKQSELKSATAQTELYKEQPLSLSLKSISPKANLSQLHRVTFTIDSKNETIPPAGVSATVEMCYASKGKPSVTIPFSALVERGGSSVWVLSEGTVESRKVEIGEIKSRGIVEIKSGLTEGEVVVVAGVNSLKEGQQVTQLAEPSPSNVGGIK